jgi:hypothetical protein
MSAIAQARAARVAKQKELKQAAIEKAKALEGNTRNRENTARASQSAVDAELVRRGDGSATLYTFVLASPNPQPKKQSRPVRPLSETEGVGGQANHVDNTRSSAVRVSMFSTTLSPSPASLSREPASGVQIRSETETETEQPDTESPDTESSDTESLETEPPDTEPEPRSPTAPPSSEPSNPYVRSRGSEVDSDPLFSTEPEPKSRPATLPCLGTGFGLPNPKLRGPSKLLGELTCPKRIKIGQTSLFARWTKTPYPSHLTLSTRKPGTRTSVWLDSPVLNLYVNEDR